MQKLRFHPSLAVAVLLFGGTSSCCAQALPADAAPAHSSNTTATAPVAIDAPLPEQAALLQQVTANGSQYVRLRPEYVCRTNLLVQPNRFAPSRKPFSQDYDSFYVNGKELHQLLAVNGNPLSDRDRDAEEVRVRGEIAFTKAAANATTNQEKPGLVPFSDTLEAAVLASDLFTAEQRSLRDGRPYISLRFRGNPHRQPRSILESIAKSLRGEVIIDEQDRAIVAFHGITQDDVFDDDQLLLPRLFPVLHYEAKRIDDRMYVPSLVTIAIARRQPAGPTAVAAWKQTLELRTYTVDSCRKFRVTSTMQPGFTAIP